MKKEDDPLGEDRTGVIDYITTAKFQNMPDDLLLKYADKDDLSEAETDTIIRELNRRKLLGGIRT